MLVVHDQVGIAEAANAVREQDAVVRQRHELRRGRAERGRVRRVPVDDGADVGADGVDARVQDRLEVEQGVRVVDGDDVVGFDLVERDSLALDPDRAVRRAGADVAERQVGVALGREDAAGPRDLLLQRLGDRHH